MSDSSNSRVHALSLRAEDIPLGEREILEGISEEYIDIRKDLDKLKEKVQEDAQQYTFKAENSLPKPENSAQNLDPTKPSTPRVNSQETEDPNKKTAQFTEINQNQRDTVPISKYPRERHGLMRARPNQNGQSRSSVRVDWRAEEEKDKMARRERVRKRLDYANEPLSSHSRDNERGSSRNSNISLNRSTLLAAHDSPRHTALKSNEKQELQKYRQFHAKLLDLMEDLQGPIEFKGREETIDDQLHEEWRFVKRIATALWESRKRENSRNRGCYECAHGCRYCHHPIKY